MKIDLLYALEKMPQILSYIHVTLWISICSMALTLVFSLVITIIRYYKNPDPDTNSKYLY